MDTADVFPDGHPLAGLPTVAQLHPSAQPAEPGRRVFRIIDGFGQGDGQPSASLHSIN